MIQLLRTIKKCFERLKINDCFISEISDEINYATPTIIITPINEEWSYNALGNLNNKVVKFKILYFDEHIEGKYDTEIESAIAKIKELLDLKEVLDEIVNFNSVTFDISLIEDNTKILIEANINLKLHRR